MSAVGRSLRVPTYRLGWAGSELVPGHAGAAQRSTGRCGSRVQTDSSGRQLRETPGRVSGG